MNAVRHSQTTNVEMEDRYLGDICGGSNRDKRCSGWMDVWCRIMRSRIVQLPKSSQCTANPKSQEKERMRTPNIADKVVVITGASSGIGMALMCSIVDLSEERPI